MSTAILILFTALLVAAIVVQYMFIKLMKRALRAGARIAIEQAWKRVNAHEHGSLKIVEADKILDEALRLLGYKGSLGDKLKKAGPRFSNLNDLWWAHKLRNKAVHELSHEMNDAEVNRAIVIYHKALTDLGARL